jgi:ribosome maturation protein Sdo1
LIEVAMNPYFGWQAEFARNHINPATNEPYSRMRITQVLELARAKVAKALERQEAA